MPDTLCGYLTLYNGHYLKRAKAVNNNNKKGGLIESTIPAVITAQCTDQYDTDRRRNPRQIRGLVPANLLKCCISK